MTLERIASLLSDENIPVWGVAPASRMAHESPGHRPQDLLPEARCLICFALPVPRAVYETPLHMTEMVWRSQNLYYRRLDTISLQVAAILEESGERALPTWGCMPQGVSDRGEVIGIFNQIRMGEVTGIGAIGRNGLLVHSRYGSRLMLGGVITTASLTICRHPDTDEPGCPQECRLCVDACPVHAISLTKRRVNVMRCLAHTSRTPFMSRAGFFIRSRLRPDSAARMMNLRAFDDHTFHVCSQCVALCPLGSAN